MFVVDTNVLVYAADRDSPAHERCRQLLVEWRTRRAPWYVSWGILYEFLRVTTHARVFRNPWLIEQSLSFVKALLAAPGLSVLVESDQHGDFLGQLAAEVPQLTGNIMHDAHTVALMHEHGVATVYTRDTDFHRFPGIEVRDPLRL